MEVTITRTVRQTIEKMQAIGACIEVETRALCMCSPREQIWQAMGELVATPVWNEKYEKIADWCADTHGTGLMLTGGCGTGKTLFATKILPVLMYRNFGIYFRVFSAWDINDREAEVLRHRHKVIDDVGVEGMRHDYGEVRDVFARTVDEAERRGHTLILTTNLTAEGIREKYGERTFDRLRKLCRVVSFEDVRSMRRSANGIFADKEGGTEG